MGGRVKNGGGSMMKKREAMKKDLFLQLKKFVGKKKKAKMKKKKKWLERLYTNSLKESVEVKCVKRCKRCYCKNFRRATNNEEKILFDYVLEVKPASKI